MASSPLEALTRSRIPYVDEYYDLLEYELDPLGGYRLRPDQRLPHVTINENGYRGRAFTGEEEVLVLGDSVTFGVGATSDEARFACFFEKFSGLPTADASVRAYRVWQHFARLPTLLRQLPRVREAFLWCGYADLLFWVISGGVIEGGFQFAQKYETSPARPRLRALVRRGLRGMVRRARVSRDRRRSVTARPSRGSLDDLVVHVSTYVCATHDLLRARQIRLRLLIQPFVRNRPETGPLRLIADAYDDKAREKCGIGWYDACALFTSALRRASHEGGAGDWVDCHSIVEESDFLDQVHLREDAVAKIVGHLIQAQAT